MNLEDPEQSTPLLPTPSEYDHNFPNNNRPSRITAQVNIRTEMTNLINRSLTLNMLQIMFSTLKIVISALMLSYYPKKCSAPVDIWLILMMSCDGLNIITLIIKISYATNFGANNRNNNQNNNRNINNINEDDRHNHNVNENEIVLPDLEQQQIENYDYIQNFEEHNIYFYYFKQAIKLYYIGILIWGHYIVYLTENDCKQTAAGLVILMVTYIIFGYFYLFYPVFIVLAICLCLPVLILTAFYFGGRGQQPANEASIDKLPKIKYVKNEFPETSCVICQNDFEENQEIIKLPCPNADHVFHNDCITHWLKINGICPICRHKI